MLAAGVVATATAAQAADSGAWTFSNPDGTLNATGTGDGAQVSVTPDGTNYTNWRLIPAGTGAFRVANTNTGKCLYSTQPLTQRSCGVGDTEDGQLWHFPCLNRWTLSRSSAPVRARPPTAPASKDSAR
ncbi:hypothetical protein ABZ726_23515, partial [Streptomyces hundungensis]|uniref:RICIN domain-containing protein n=1 Tax=Streptomyces hundungensis TaxID=1077946 RepID=UPI00347BF57D